MTGAVQSVTVSPVPFGIDIYVTNPEINDVSLTFGTKPQEQSFENLTQDFFSLFLFPTSRGMDSRYL
jgi:hypothetical protein